MENYISFALKRVFHSNAFWLLTSFYSSKWTFLANRTQHVIYPLVILWARKRYPNILPPRMSFWVPFVNYLQKYNREVSYCIFISLFHFPWIAQSNLIQLSGQTWWIKYVSARSVDHSISGVNDVTICYNLDSIRLGIKVDISLF